MSDSGTRINKFLSEVGYCSRRQADALIDQGRIYVNRKPAKMGMKVSEDDMIEVDGEKINQSKKKKIFIAEVLCVQLMRELKKIILLIF
jgi:23S rRNA pseudouridine2604 synthase